VHVLRITIIASPRYLNDPSRFRNYILDLTMFGKGGTQRVNWIIIYHNVQISLPRRPSIRY